MSGGLSIEIKCRGAAFGETQEEAATEVARILRTVAKELELLADAPTTLRDYNGNTVGKCSFDWEAD